MALWVHVPFTCCVERIPVLIQIMDSCSEIKVFIGSTGFTFVDIDLIDITKDQIQLIDNLDKGFQDRYFVNNYINHPHPIDVDLADSYDK